MAKLITEASYNVEIYESKNKDIKFIAGIFSSADIMVANGRKYPKSILEREVEKINEQVNNKCCWGELGHPPSPDLNLDRVAILITDLSWKQNNVYGKAEIVEDTPCGKIAKALVEKGKIGISSRGLGSINENTKEVNEDFKLVTWDLVGTPSNKSSWINGIYEGKEWDIVEKKENQKTQLDIILEKYNNLWEALDYTLKEGLKEEHKIISGMIRKNIK